LLRGVFGVTITPGDLPEMDSDALSPGEQLPTPGTAPPRVIGVALLGIVHFHLPGADRVEILEGDGIGDFSLRAVTVAGTTPDVEVDPAR
jgi:hypothetical protein